MRICLCDSERGCGRSTTGTDPARDAIVEIASVDDNTITNQIATLVRPGIPVPAEASAVHPLIDVDLAVAPPLEQVIDQFRGADAYIAHKCQNAGRS